MAVPHFSVSIVARGSGRSAVLSGLVTFLCRPRCSFKPPFVRRRQGFSSPVLSADDVDCRSR